MADRATFSVLDPQKVVATIGVLQKRIEERFAGSGLANVCGELQAIAATNTQRAEKIARGNTVLRAGIFALLLLGIAAIVWIITLIHSYSTTADNIYSVLQGIEAAANLAVLIGAALFFLVRSEERLKRREALTALHELRSIVHVIDMHQLTKDPSADDNSIGGKTSSSPPRILSRYLLARYLDYSSEMVSLTSKVAVLFSQSFPDPDIIDAVSDIERIAAGLSQKIWQKIMILELQGNVTPATGS